MAFGLDKKDTFQLLTVVGVFAVATGVAYLYWYFTPQRLNVLPFNPKNKKAIKDATLE
jgi:hypothetical protein